jgi:hypothetical protein
MPLRPSSQAALSAALACAACGSADWELDVTVRIPAAALADYSGGYPAQVVVLSDRTSPSDPASTGGTAQRIANLCSASDTLVTIETKLSGTDCAPRYVRAWLEHREEGAESKCGNVDPPKTLIGIRKPPYDAPQTKASEFSEDSGDCLTGTHAVNLTLTTGRR